MKLNEDKLRQMAQAEKEQYHLPETVVQGVEETLEALPEKNAEVIPLSRGRRASKWIGAIAAAFIAVFLVLPNTGYPVAQALSDLPVLGTVFRAVTFRDYAEETDTTDISVKTPKIEADDKNNEAAAAAGEEIDAMNEAAVRQFKKEHADGSYGSLDIYYDVAADTDRWYTVRVVREETAASGAVEESYYTFDKKSGKVVILSDLFEKDAYIADLSQNVKAQMRAQMKEDDSVSYFLDSDLPEEDFDEIDPNQDFYIDKDGDLVLCFDEYEVAPGSMGTVKFKVPQKAYQSDLKPEYK